MNRLLPSALCLFLLAGLALSAEPDKLPPPAKKKIAYEKDILPLLKKNCYKCHADEKQEGNLRLDRRESALAGGDSGVVIKSGKSAESLLIQLAGGLDPEESMPPGDEKLTSEQVGILRAWIDQGVDWPDKFKDGPGK